jgi:hypothetical protein
LVARFGDVVVVLGRPADGQSTSAAPGDADVVPALLGELERWSGGSNPAPDEVCWTLATQLVAHRRVLPSIGAAVRVAGGYRVFLRGSAKAVIAGPGGDRELVGTSAATWVDVLVDEPLTSFSITAAGSGPIRAQPHSDLRGGLVNGSGVVLTPRPATRYGSNDPVETAPQTGRPLTVPDVRDPRVDDVRPPPARPVTATAETLVVRSTDAVLLADDGTRTVLDRDYVLGRDPQHDPSVTRGAASPVAVRDPDNLISRAQVYVEVRAGVVTVRDNRSTNGTFIAAAGAAEWQRIGGEPTPLPPGWSMRIGRRGFTHVENDNLG